MIRTTACTKKGFEKIKREKEIFLAERKEAVNNLKIAREMGDLSENGAYKAARQELNRIDSRVRYLTNVIKNAVVVSDIPKDQIGIGSRVALEINGKACVYEIVGSFESNPPEGKISHLSPLGKQLIGKKTNDEVRVYIPGGISKYKIRQILNS